MFKNALIFIIIMVIVISFGINHSAFGSPANDAMLDADGCHVCKINCEKFGLEKNQRHCHMITSAMRTEYVHPGQSNSEAVYGANVISAFDCINLTGDKTSIIFLPGNKDMAAEYKALSQQCSYGGGPFQIRNGAPSTIKKIFNASYDPNMPGVYTWTVLGKDYLLLYTRNKRALVLDHDSNILCAGNLIKGTLSMFCKTSFSNERADKTERYCRTALIPTS